MSQDATFTLLSGSTNGRPIKVTQTATTGTTIHQSVNSTSQWDRIFLWAVNSSANPVKLTLEWGGTSSPDDLIEQTIEPESGEVLLTQGIPLNNNLLVTAFAATANVINITGYVLRVA